VYHSNVELLVEAQFLLQQRSDTVLCNVTGDHHHLSALMLLLIATITKMYTFLTTIYHVDDGFCTRKDRLVTSLQAGGAESIKFSPIARIQP
jgi:hypothetical protein